jgi:hypothetical protein
MTERQDAWFDDLQKRDPATYSAKDRRFLSDTQAVRRQYERDLHARYSREQQEMIDGQWGDTHPGLDTAEGREMENPRR